MLPLKSALFGCIFALVTSVAAVAAEPVEQYNSTALWFENWIGLSNATLIVAAPDGTVTTVHAARGTPVFQLPGRDVVDGTYRYELSAATEEKVKIVNQLDNGRGDAQQDSLAKPFRSSGHFTVSRGVIITPEDIKEEES